MRVRVTPMLAIVLAGCGALHEGSSTSEAAATSGGIDPSATGSSEESTGAEASEESSSGAPPGSDPSYPAPTPIDELGSCPAGFLGPITFDGTGWGCIPECDAAGECPNALSGDAPGRCSTNPQSSATSCTNSDDCTVDGEMCGNAGMDRMACLLPPSHCILRCDDGETCPDAMTCTTSVGICQYLP